MMPLLAQAPSFGFADIGLWLVIAFYLMTQGVTAWRAFRKDPPDHQVYATRDALRETEDRLAMRLKSLEEHHDKVEDKLDDIRRQSATNYAQLQASDEARSANIHRRVNSLEETIRKLPGEILNLLKGSHHA